MPKHFDRYVLKDWPEDRLPVCAAPTCSREIKNGDPYAVLSGTVKLVCLSCALDPFMRDATLTEMTHDSVAKEREARVRRAALAQSQRRRSRKTRKKARTVVVRPEKPPEVRRGRYRYPPHPCRYCEVVFQPRAAKLSVGGVTVRGPQPYCSVSCSVRGRRTPYRQFVCPACDQVFAPKRGSSSVPQTCCSRACARWWFPRRLRNPHPQPVLWSRSWGICCRACGKSDRRHKGQGYCVRCYRLCRQDGTTRAREPKRPDRSWTERMQRRSYVAAAAAAAEAAAV